MSKLLFPNRHASGLCNRLIIVCGSIHNAKWEYSLGRDKLTCENICLRRSKGDQVLNSGSKSTRLYNLSLVISTRSNELGLFLFP